MIAAVYARKSNEQEKAASGASESCDRQIEHARAYLAAKPWADRVGAPVRAGAELVFYDDDVSGATYARLVNRKRMIAAAEAGAFQVLVVSEQSRLGRDMIEVAYTIKQIAESGVRIFSYLDDAEISVEDEVAQAMTMLRGFASASERRQTSKRVYDAALRRVKAGQVAGAKVFGYDNVPILGPGGKRDHVERRVNAAQAAIVVRIFTLYAEGLGSVRIARQLNAEGIPAPRPRGWSQTTVRGILRNPLYVGEVLWGRIKTVVRRGKDHNLRRPESEWLRQERQDLRIVPAALWQTVQARRTRNRRAIPRNPRTGHLLGRPTWHDGHSAYLVTGFGRCVTCGGNIRITHRVHGPQHRRVAVRSYTCAVNDNLGRAKCANDVLVRYDLLDRAILSALAEVLDAGLLEAAVDRALDRLRAERTPTVDRRAALQQEHQAAQQRIERLVDALADGTAPTEDITRRLTTETARKAALAAELEALQGQGAPPLDVDRLRAAYRAQVADLRALLTEDVQQGRALLRALLDGPIDCHAFREPGRRGFRFEGRLTWARLTTGEVAQWLVPPDPPRPASLTGTFAGGRCAAAPARAPRACDCHPPGSAWPRAGVA